MLPWEPEVAASPRGHSGLLRCLPRAGLPLVWNCSVSRAQDFPFLGVFQALSEKRARNVNTFQDLDPQP